MFLECRALQVWGLGVLLWQIQTLGMEGEESLTSSAISIRYSNKCGCVSTVQHVSALPQNSLPEASMSHGNFVTY